MTPASPSCPAECTDSQIRLARRQALKLMALAAIGAAGCGRERPDAIAFPAFSLPDPDGVLHDIREYAGQPLLVNFWATWCPPCRAEMADLDALHRTLAPRGLRLLAISVDADRNLVREFLRSEKVGFAVLIDEQRRWSAHALKLNAFPTTYLVGRNGAIRAEWVGARSWAHPAMQADIMAKVALG